MLSFHNDIEVKEKYVNRVKAHAKADNLIQGTGWENGKGCAIGCTLESFDHSAYPTELGLPEWLARLEDRLFEGMENKYAMKFPLDFLEAIPVGVSLEPVKWKFCSYLCSDNIARVENLDIDWNLKKQVLTAIKHVKLIHDNAIETGVWDASAACAARSAADSAARSAADSAAAYSAAAYSAADSAAWSASSAARSAAAYYSIRFSSSRFSILQKYADHLLKLLREA